MLNNPYDRNDHYIHMYNAFTYNYIRSFGNWGSGPGEFNSPVAIQPLNGSPYWHILDINIRRLYTLSLDSILKFPNYIPTKYVNTNVILDEPKLVNELGLVVKAQLSDSTFLAVYFPTFDERFAIVNTNMEVIKSFGEFPKLENEGVDENAFYIFFLGTFYQNGNVRVNTQNNTFVVTHHLLDLIEVFDYISGENIFNIIGPDKNYPPEYRSVNNNGIWSVGTCLDCNMGYTLSTSSKEYIFALMPEKKFYSEPKGDGSKYIYQFDWEGQFIRKYKLPKEVFNISYDSKSERLYVLDYNSEYVLTYFQISADGILY